MASRRRCRRRFLLAWRRGGFDKLVVFISRDRSSRSRGRHNGFLTSDCVACKKSRYASKKIRCAHSANKPQASSATQTFSSPVICAVGSDCREEKV